MATSLVRMVALCQPSKCPLCFPGVLVGRVTAKPFDCIPVYPFLNFLLMFEPLSFRACRSLLLDGDVFCDHLDPRLDTGQASAEQPLAIALGRAYLAFQMLTNLFPVRLGFFKGVCGVRLAAKIAERPLCRLAFRIAIVLDQQIASGVSGTAEVDEGHGQTN